MGSCQPTETDERFASLDRNAGHENWISSRARKHDTEEEAMLTQLKSSALVVALGIAGCASTLGAKPHDMSPTKHEQAAAQHEQAAVPHAAAYDPNAKETTETCARPYGGCWTSETNPTAEHKANAESHRKMAADHRAAARALRDAEGRSCTGVSATDRDLSPFEHRQDIEGVVPYRAASSGAALYHHEPTSVAGAVMSFRAAPGMTVEWLQRVVDCHLARNASMGFDMPEMSFCPLAVKGARAKVASTGSGFAVTVDSDDPRATQEILRRPQALRR
jgi:hypothetical protein